MHVNMTVKNSEGGLYETPRWSLLILIIQMTQNECQPKA